MVPMAEACDECTQNCLLMHKKEKNPSPVATTFFKVMIGDDYSKRLVLPPRFARSIRNMVGKTTELEDTSGDKWTVKFTKVDDDLLAFGEGWNTFSLNHGLKVGDFLVFHYIMESHFVVLMYGPSGCPEIRHFGLVQHQLRETSKKHKLITDDRSPSNVNTNGHYHSYQSSSQSERSVYGLNKHPEMRLSIGTQCKRKKTKKKTSKKRSVSSTMSPDVNTTNTDCPMFLSSSRPGPSVSEKETSQRSEPLIRNRDQHNMISKTPTMKQCHLVYSDTGNIEDECRRNGINDLLIPEINLDESDGDLENNVAVGGGGDETQINESGKVLVTRSEELKKRLPSIKQCHLVNSDTGNIEDECRRNGLNDLLIPEINLDESNGDFENNVAVGLGGGGDKTQINESGKVLETRSEELKKRLKESTVRTSKPTYNIAIKKRLRGTNVPVRRAKMAKIEPSETEASDSRLHDVGGQTASPGIFHKPIDKPMEVIKKEIIMNHGSTGHFVNVTKTGCYGSVTGERTPTVKPEPIDCDEAPPFGTTNTSFSTVMCNYKYLEVPKWVKLKSNVILLRNVVDLWPLLYQSKAGLKALTQGWDLFARERGIQPGDVCEFVLESEPKTRFTCNVFTVHVTRK